MEMKNTGPGVFTISLPTAYPSPSMNEKSTDASSDAPPTRWVSASTYVQVLSGRLFMVKVSCTPSFSYMNVVSYSLSWFSCCATMRSVPALYTPKSICGMLRREYPCRAIMSAPYATRYPHSIFGVAMGWNFSLCR